MNGGQHDARPEHVQRAREAARKRKAATKGKPAGNGKPTAKQPADECPPDQQGDAHEGPPSDEPTKPVASGPWDPPIELVTIANPEPFPIAIFPHPLQQYIREGGKALNCPADYFAVPMLGIAGGCIGNSRWLSITRTHHQSAALFECVVGTKGTAKSPALKMVREPLDKAQRDRRQTWERAMLAWEEADEKTRGPQPIMGRVIIGDVTTESLSVLLDENTRGLELVRDELAGMLASMNQYKGGGGHDRQWFLELWSHTLSPRDRKSD
jgi:Protein of unknown function (DUF3987)